NPEHFAADVLRPFNLLLGPLKGRKIRQLQFLHLRSPPVRVYFLNLHLHLTNMGRGTQHLFSRRGLISIVVVLLPYQIGSDNHSNQRHGQQIDHFPASNLFFAISTYSGFNSIPIHWRPCFSATRPVVPEPKNGSRTMPRPLPSLFSH